VPALVEIEVLKRDLEKEVVGRRIKDAEIRPGSNAMKVVPKHGRRKEFQDLLEGAKIESVRRAGLKLVLELDNDHAMILDLGPGGRLVKTSASDDLEPHTHIVVPFTIGGQMRFVDPAKRGEVYVAPRAELDDLVTTEYEIDPLDHQVAWQRFSQILIDRKQPLKELLMDEGFIAGLGDVYSDEILWEAGLRYDRHSDDLSSQDVRRLYRGLMEVLQEAVKARGLTYGEDGFTDLHGDPGEYQRELKVYGRDGAACPRCRHTIFKEKVGKQVTYFCPQCQS
jgi:formamidopyrimidine-DNA glycosylase